MFSSCGVALGLVILSRGGFSGYQSLLIGDILSISSGQLLVLGITLGVVAVLWLLCFNQFHAVSISASLARSKGLPVGLLDNLFVVVIAVVVMLAIQWVGLLLINAMLILPAAAARNVARSMRSYLALALIFSLFSGLLGCACPISTPWRPVRPSSWYPRPSFSAPTSWAGGPDSPSGRPPVFHKKKRGRPERPALFICHIPEVSRPCPHRR